MHLKTVLFIVNPISGTNKKAKIVDLIRQFTDKNVFDFSIAYTEKAGHATEIAQKAVQQGISTVVAVGGDGTVNEVARALFNSQTALYIIPTGSGNGLARHLEIPLNPKKAILHLVKTTKKLIDTCLLNGKPFFCTSGLGFDAFISGKFATASGRGLWNYLRIGFASYWNYKARNYQIFLDGKEITGNFYVLTVANAAQFGNNFHISPEAKIDDGIMDICLMKSVKTLSALKLMFQSYRKKIHLSRHIEILRGKELNIQRIHAETVHLDGDPVLMPEKLEYRILPKSLWVCK